MWLLYFQTVIWITQIYYPFTTVLAPFMLVILFKLSWLDLSKLSVRPKKSSNASDTGFFIMIFLNLTFFIISAIIVMQMALNLTHDQWVSDQSNLCGPFASGSYGLYSIKEMINKNTVIKTIYQVDVYYPFLWLCGILLLTLMLFKRNHAELLREFVVIKDNEY